MAALPTGTVTFLFTDIEGSTRLATESADQFPKILERHHALLRQAFGAHEGVEVITEGDAFFVVFSSPLALSARCRCPTPTWPTGRAPHNTCARHWPSSSRSATAQASP